MARISVPARRWYENEEREPSFPERWQVDELSSPGLDKPGLSADAIRARIEHPVAGPPLEDLAPGKKQAVIVFDDMTRPTPVRDVVPFVLAALHRAGMRKEQIRFLWGLGSHGTYDMIAARKKLGDDVVEHYAVYNHDAFDCLINRRGEITSLYSGPFRATHARGAAEAKEHYGIPCAGGYDVAVCNSYGKANEAAIALMFAPLMLRAGVGTAVLIADAPEGQVPHDVWRSWAPNYGGRQFVPRVEGFIGAFAKRLIVLTPHPDPTSLDFFCHPNDAVVVKTWSEALAILEQDHPGATRVGVVQDGTMQYMKPPASSV